MIFKLERAMLTKERIDKLTKYYKLDLVAIEEDSYVFRCNKKL